MGRLGRGSAVLLVVLLGVLGAANVATATTYPVGGNGTWTIPTLGSNEIDYQPWANSHKFKFGDELVFQYNNNSHSVLLVNSTGYGACDINQNDDIQGWDSGDDVIELNFNLTEYYFICGTPGHCASGQKFHISVAAFAPAPEIIIHVPTSPPGSAPGLQPSGFLMLLSLLVAFCTAHYVSDGQGFGFA